MSSILINPDCIKKWRQAAPNDQSFIMLENYSSKVVTGLQARRDVYKSFATDPSKLFFEGIATKDGFGCPKNSLMGWALMLAAAKKNCPHSLNYLGLCLAQNDLTKAASYFYRSAQFGHLEAANNLRTIRSMLPAAHRPRMLCAV